MAETVSNKVIRLETQMINVENKVDKLDAKIDSLITKVDHFSDLQTEISNLKESIVYNAKKLETLESRSFRNGWLFPTLSAAAATIASSIFTILIIDYLNHKSH